MWKNGLTIFILLAYLVELIFNEKGWLALDFLKSFPFLVLQRNDHLRYIYHIKKAWYKTWLFSFWLLRDGMIFIKCKVVEMKKHRYKWTCCLSTSNTDYIHFSAIFWHSMLLRQMNLFGLNGTNWYIWEKHDFFTILVCAMCSFNFMGLYFYSFYNVYPP